MPSRLFLSMLLVGATLWVSGCRTAYYATWEKLGKHKRDLLKDNVEEVRDDQEEATEQFKDALTRLRELYQFEGGELEDQYNALQADFDRSEAKANKVKERIRKVEQIAADLFKEWEKELESMQNARLQSSSRVKLAETRQKYESLHVAMVKAEESMEPVLTQFRDQVLFLKHNLNARAIGALKGETQEIEREVEQLIRDMQNSIDRANEFIQSMPE